MYISNEAQFEQISKQNFTVDMLDLREELPIDSERMM